MFRIRRLALVSVTAVLLTGAVTTAHGSPSAARSQTPARGGVLNVLSLSGPDYLDPNLTYYSIGYNFIRAFSRQLYTLSARAGHTTDAVPDLATGAPQISDQGRTYRVTIRSGARWNASPPRQVTAADVVRGVKITCNPYTPFAGLPDFESLLVGFASFCQGFANVAPTPAAISHYISTHSFAGVQASAGNSRTVVFHLTHQASYFRDLLVMPALSPRAKEQLAYLPGSPKDEQHTVSDGPYTVASYLPGQKVVFVRNPAWKRSVDAVRKAYVDKMVITLNNNTDAAVQAMRTGSPKADIYMGSIGYSDAARFRANHDPRLTLMSEIAVNPYLLFNCSSPNNNAALQQVKVRQAISYALDRSDILTSVGYRQFNPALTHVLPPGIVGSQQFDAYPHDQTTASTMLQDAGATNMTLTYLYEQGFGESTAVFQAVKRELSQVGITVVGKAVPPAEFYSKYLLNPSAAQAGNWDMVQAGWGPDWYGNAALSIFAPLFDGRTLPPQSSNYGLFNDPNVNALIDEGAASSSSQAASIWHQADVAVMQDAPIFPLADPIIPLYHATQVHNAVGIPLLESADLTNVWLSPKDNGG